MNGNSTPVWIGQLNATSYDRFFNGYIHDLRVTKGVARYTADFILPKGLLPIK